ncbi:MAG: TIM barrel protein [Acidobacteriota bacterium]
MITRRGFHTVLAAGAVSARELLAAAKLRLGIGTYTYHALSIDDMIEQLTTLRIKEIEMSRGEFMTFSKPPVERFVSFRKKIDNAGIRCVSYYAPTIKKQEDLDDAVRFAKILGASNISGDPEGEWLKATDERLTAEKMTFGIHNHYFKQKFVYESPEDILNALKGRSKTMGCTLDLGHIVSCGYNTLDAVRKLISVTRVIHLKDIKAAGGEINVPLGTGLVKVDQVMAELKKLGYKGLIAFEYEREGEIKQDVAAQIAYARKLL